MRCSYLKLCLVGIIVVSYQSGSTGQCYAKGVFGKSVSKAIARKSAGKVVGRKAIQKSTKQKAYTKVLQRDALRDSKTKAKTLIKARKVNRYTSSKKALFEKKNGLKPGTHMTSGVKRGRPITSQTAKQRYGLARKPRVRMQILVPKGQPVRKNKVIGGKAGQGEWTSTKKIPNGNILSIKKIK